MGPEATFKLDEKLDFAPLAYTIDHMEANGLRWIEDFDRRSIDEASDLKYRGQFD